MNIIEFPEQEVKQNEQMDMTNNMKDDFIIIFTKYYEKRKNNLFEEWKKENAHLEEKYRPILEQIEKEHNTIMENLSQIQTVVGNNELVATGTHHFQKGLTLIVTGDEWKWIYSSDKSGSQTNQKYLDPTNSIENFVNLIDIVFRFTGVCFDISYSHTFDDCIQIKTGEDMKTMTTLELIRWIYDRPLEHKVRMVHLATCGCNMGHCGAIVGIEIDETEYQTYGDLMKLFGGPIRPKEDPDNEYYGYPDSVCLSIRYIYDLPSSIYDGNSCYSKRVPVTQTLDPNITYLSWEYSR